MDRIPLVKLHFYMKTAVLSCVIDDVLVEAFCIVGQI